MLVAIVRFLMDDPKKQCSRENVDFFYLFIFYWIFYYVVCDYVMFLIFCMFFCFVYSIDAYSSPCMAL